MLSPTAESIRLFLHVLAASVWVGGQIVLGGLVPKLRQVSP
jgi:putative copper export protein